MKKIGILGGGQLGMLLAQSIVRLGAEALIYDPDSKAPAIRAVRTSTHAEWHDKNALAKFLSSCDKATYEFENIPCEALQGLEQITPILPSPEVLRITQNRAQEKDFLRINNLPHVPYIVCDTIESLSKQVSKLSFPAIVKSTTGGYDGKAQNFFGTRHDLESALQQSPVTLPPFPVIVEKAIDLYMEVSCITANSSKGESIVFPVFQNAHKNHILDTTIVPANLPEEILTTVQDLAKEAANKLKVTGILCTEFFISNDNKQNSSSLNIDRFSIYINEFAPRPHNSGHVTTSSCNLSQFDALARILLDIPLCQPVLPKNTYFCMANLLGDIWPDKSTGHGDRLDLTKLPSCQEKYEVFLYGKDQALPGRKMGHLIARADSADKALETAIKLRDLLKTV